MSTQPREPTHQKVFRLTQVFFLVSTVVDATLYFFKTEEGTTSGISILRLAVYGALALWLIVVASRERVLDRTGRLLAIFLLYLLALVPFSSNASDSFAVYSRVFIGLSFYVIGYYCIRSYDTLQRLQRIFQVCAVIIAAQILIANWFDINVESLSSYNDEFVKFGGGNVENAKTACLALLSMPIAFAGWKRMRVLSTIWQISAMTLAVIAILLYFNRSALAGLVIGFSVMFAAARKWRRLTWPFLVIGVAGAIAVSYLEPVISPLFEDRVQTRELSEEARAREVVIVLDDMFQKPLGEVLFGSEIFNSQTVGFGELWLGRQLHTDYTVMLHGAGALGFALYVGIFVSALVAMRGPRRRLKGNPAVVAIWPVCCGMVAAAAVFSYGGGMDAIGHRSVLMCFLGGAVRTLKVAAADYARQTAAADPPRAGFQSVRVMPVRGMLPQAAWSRRHA